MSIPQKGIEGSNPSVSAISSINYLISLRFLHNSPARVQIYPQGHLRILCLD